MSAETDPMFLTTPEASAMLRVPVATLYAWRHRGIGPPSARVGRRVLYRPEDLHKYVEDRMVEGGRVVAPTPPPPVAETVPPNVDNFEALPESARAALCVEDCAREVLEVLRLSDHHRHRLLVHPGGVPDEVRADLLAALTDLVQTVGAFRDAAHELVLSAASDGPVVTSDGKRGWKRAEHRSGGFGGNPYLVPLTPTELGELT
jgi:excisionase family DNA binding protein